MGAWGYGPFDSDSALDYFVGLARVHGTLDEDGQVVPGSVDHPAVVSALRVTLAQAARIDDGTDDQYDLVGACTEAYAAAGLVAAARQGDAVKDSGGTRLFATLEAGALDAPGQGDLLGLDTHCGFVELLPRQDAHDLADAALAATAALSTQQEWLNIWKSATETGRALANLTEVLNRPAPSVTDVTVPR